MQTICCANYQNGAQCIYSAFVVQISKIVLSTFVVQTIRMVLSAFVVQTINMVSFVLCKLQSFCVVQIALFLLFELDSVHRLCHESVYVQCITIITPCTVPIVLRCSLYVWCVMQNAN